MTLSTDLVIADPLGPRSLFDHALGLVAADFDGEPSWADDGARLRTTPGQGLAAILSVTYATDGPLEPDEDDSHPAPFGAYCVRVNFDTAYGYQGDNGAGCEDLHAWLVAELARWLDDRGITRWAWQNEFTGAWYGPGESLSALGDPERGRLATNAGAWR